MKGHRQIITYLLLTLFALFSTAAVALPQDTVMNTGQERDGGLSFSASYVHQFDTDIGRSGDFVWTRHVFVLIGKGK